MKKAYIRFQNLTHSRWAKKVFTDISGNINGGDVVGVIGDNGTGKTTFLQVLAGSLESNEGTVEKKWTIWVVDQGLEQWTLRTVRDYLTQREPKEDRECEVALWKVGGDEIRLEQKLHTLSWGQTTKVRIAKQLIDECDILLLDEPTNHLDREGTQTLVGFIKRFPWPIVVVSHDRRFLDAVCTHIFDLSREHLEVYTGNYTTYLHERDVRLEKQLQDRKMQETKRKKMELRLADLRQRASVYDSPKRGKLIRSREKQYNREFVRDSVEKPKTKKAMAMQVWWGRHKHKKIVQITAGDIHIASTVLYETDDLLLLWKDRVLLAWPNGSWKTTLLSQLKRTYEAWKDDARVIRGNDIRIAFFDQLDDTLRIPQPVMTRAAKHFPDSRSEATVRSKLATAWIPTEDLVKRLDQLSYGQRVKLRFLEMMVQQYDLLILDEPTNHLDIATRESLELMLQNYEGALLVVSHDRRFVEQIGVETMRKISDGMCVEEQLQS